MANNLYYSTYYVLSRFSKRFNNKDGDYAFTAIFYFMILFGLNVLAILFVSLDALYLKSHVPLIIGIAVAVPCLIHYFGLINNKRYLKVIDAYEEQKYDTSTLSVVVIIYIIITILSTLYIASLIRSQFVH